MKVDEWLGDLEFVTRQASPAPWTFHHCEDDQCNCRWVHGSEGRKAFGSDDCDPYTNTTGDLQFVAASRNALPVLVKMVRFAKMRAFCSDAAELQRILDESEK